MTAKKPTIKGLIQDLVVRGRTLEAIMKEIRKKFPESKADEGHVKYYSAELKRAGKITEEQHAKYLDKKKPVAKKKAPAKKKTTAARSSGKTKTAAKKKPGRVRVKTGAKK